MATPLNPLLASLGNNGGPTPTMALLSGSPAIGAGASINGITTDQRGFARPASGPDIGAYQSEAIVTVTDAGGVYNGSLVPRDRSQHHGDWRLERHQPRRLHLQLCRHRFDDIRRVVDRPHQRGHVHRHRHLLG